MRQSVQYPFNSVQVLQFIVVKWERCCNTLPVQKSTFAVLSLASPWLLKLSVMQCNATFTGCPKKWETALIVWACCLKTWIKVLGVSLTFLVCLQTTSSMNQSSFSIFSVTFFGSPCPLSFIIPVSSVLIVENFFENLSWCWMTCQTGPTSTAWWWLPP